jgi:hypothetical protein
MKVWTHRAQVRSVSQPRLARDDSLGAARTRAGADCGLVLSGRVMVQARLGLAARQGDAVSIMRNVERLHPGELLDLLGYCGPTLSPMRPEYLREWMFFRLPGSLEKIGPSGTRFTTKLLFFYGR